MLASDDKIFFEYKAFEIPGGDWFEVGVGLYEGDVLKGCKVYRGKEMDNFTTDYFDIPGSGNYKLGFFVGSYEKTGVRTYRRMAYIGPILRGVQITQ